MKIPDIFEIMEMAGLHLCALGEKGRFHKLDDKYSELLTTMAYLGINTINSHRFYSPILDPVSTFHGLTCRQSIVRAKEEVIISINDFDIDYDGFESLCSPTLKNVLDIIANPASYSMSRVPNYRLCFLYPEALTEKVQGFIDQANEHQEYKGWDYLNIPAAPYIGNSDASLQKLKLVFKVEHFPYRPLTPQMVRELRSYCEEPASLGSCLHLNLVKPLKWLENCLTFLEQPKKNKHLVYVISSDYESLHRDEDVVSMFMAWTTVASVLKFYYESYLLETKKLDLILISKSEKLETGFDNDFQINFYIKTHGSITSSTRHVNPICEALKLLAEDKNLYLCEVEKCMVLRHENSINSSLSSMLKQTLPLCSKASARTEEVSGRNRIDVVFNLDNKEVRMECKIACKEGSINYPELDKAFFIQAPSYIMNGFGTQTACLVFYINGLELSEFQTKLTNHYEKLGYSYSRVTNNNANWYQICTNPEDPDVSTFDVFTVVLPHKTNSQLHKENKLIERADV